MRDISAVQYFANNTWYNAQITEKYISGNKLYIKFVTTDNLALTITAIRILDRDGVEAGYRADYITKNATQGLLYALEAEIDEGSA
ncbi:MAG: hypothetical protein PHS57_06375 [Alphaproteobacteria bacterium]|nr:hypothetical protein [Alphaproteobacteria bacterium]